MLDRHSFLLVEDYRDDVILIQRSFLKANILNPLQVVSSGEEAIAYLAGSDKFGDRTQYPLPSVIFLDLGLPGISGCDVLKWIRSSSPAPGVRVVVLTSSSSIADVDRAYRCGADSFLIKPMDFERFVEFSLAMKGCWLWRPDSQTLADAETTSPTDTELLRRRLLPRPVEEVQRRVSF
jgi:CheY-like chemotaxis protein